jgi:hypothetical protein
MTYFSNNEILSKYFNDKVVEFKQDDDDDDDFEDFYNEFCLLIDDNGIDDNVIAGAFMAKINFHYELLGE